ncbi:hypothetical protein HY496_02490 [Candidatus Woesearchaeota archaeon]|nr:hypothetical protein [Candidatus Woesearchaeota archaeon]
MPNITIELTDAEVLVAKQIMGNDSIALWAQKCLKIHLRDTINTLAQAELNERQKTDTTMSNEALAQAYLKRK